MKEKKLTVSDAMRIFYEDKRDKGKYRVKVAYKETDKSKEYVFDMQRAILDSRQRNR